jgi:hypothetical protein
MTFEEYLVAKKINIQDFSNYEAARFQEWKQLFSQVHPESFTAQKKFLLNDVRRKYLLKNEE